LVAGAVLKSAELVVRSALTPLEPAKEPDVHAPSTSATGARRRLLLALLAVLAVAAVFAAMAPPQPSAITRDNEARILEGMTMDELAAILGGPPRDESTGPTDLDPDGFTQARVHAPAPNGSPISEWFSDEVMIRVAFDARGRAEWISSCPLRRTYGIQPTLQHWLYRYQMRFR
jgi:hypothetical protein